MGRGRPRNTPLTFIQSKAKSLPTIGMEVKAGTGCQGLEFSRSPGGCIDFQKGKNMPRKGQGASSPHTDSSGEWGFFEKNRGRRSYWLKTTAVENISSGPRRPERGANRGPPRVCVNVAYNIPSTREGGSHVLTHEPPHQKVEQVPARKRNGNKQSSGEMD